MKITLTLFISFMLAAVSFSATNASTYYLYLGGTE